VTIPGRLLGAMIIRAEESHDPDNGRQVTGHHVEMDRRGAPVLVVIRSGGILVADLGKYVIAIDGPAASGKSTVAAEIADQLDALLFDTGAVYRVLTLVALARGVSPDDEDELAELIDKIDITITTPSVDDGRQYDVYIDDADVTWAIRDPEVDRAVSPVSVHARVRAGLLELQRKIGHSGQVVMPGRDVGTVVMPDADLKIWLDASLDERARRRQSELKERGIDLSIKEIREEMRQRDQRDSSRSEAPMEPAPDAVVIVTDDRDVEDVVKQILQLASLIPAIAEEGGTSS
jgi:CMP/dCMP kinase